VHGKSLGIITMTIHEDFDNICATCAFYMQHGFMDYIYIKGFSDYANWFNLVYLEAHMIFLNTYFLGAHIWLLFLNNKVMRWLVSHLMFYNDENTT